MSKKRKQKQKEKRNDYIKKLKLDCEKSLKSAKEARAK